MEELLDSLRDDLIRKCGQPLIYSKDCYFLSEDIRKNTSRSVSTTTLKRFFKLVEHNHNTSRFVLDTFSIYLGFDSWTDYLNCLDKKKHTSESSGSWDLLRKRINPITRSSLNSIKLKTGYNKKKFIIRPFANRIFSDFYGSDKTITALIAPEGYGKSSIIVQVADSFFQGERAMNQHDILCLIDGELFINLLSNNQGVELIEQFNEFDIDTSLLRYFADESNSVEGHVVIIIDDVDEIYFQEDKFHDFAGNLMKIVRAYDGKPWFKLILTFKPENLRVFTYFLERSASLGSQWFGVAFSDNTQGNINIPLFREEEVREIMKLNKFRLPIESLHYFHYDMINVIKYPYLLFSLIDLNRHNVMVSELDLIEDYVKNKITSGAYGNEKQEIIASFLKLCEYGDMSVSVRKKSLPLEDQRKIAYDELVSYGIIYETQIQENYLTRSVFCRFLNKNLFNYITALTWINLNGISISLFRKLNSHYRYNHALKQSVARCLIKVAIKEGNLELLKQIHRYFEKKWASGDDYKERNYHSYYRDLSQAICLELRSYREHRDEMMKFYATTPLGRSLFFESNFDFDSLVMYSSDNYKYYLESTKTPVSVTYAGFMNFMKGFLSGNDSICHNSYEINRQNETSGLKDPLTVGLSDAIAIIYQSCILKYARLKTIEEIIQTSEYLNSSEAKQQTKIPVYEFTILFSLSFTDRFRDIIKLADHIQSYYNLSGLGSSPYYQYFTLCYAQASLHSDQEEKALILYHQAVSTEVPPLMRYFLLIMKYFIDIDFALHEGNNTGALTLIKNIRNISRVLQFRYFFNRADKLRNLIQKSADRVMRK